MPFGNLKEFRAAFIALGMISADVGKAVARFEAELGVTLVARATRSMGLTSVGAAFHARCGAIRADLELPGQKAAAGGATLPQRRLAVSMSQTFGRLRVMPGSADFVAH